MAHKHSPPALSTRITVTTITAYIFAVCLIAGFAYFAMTNVDEQALKRQRDFAADGLRQVLDRVPKEQESITVWDDAVIQVRAGNQTWMLENIGEWVADYFGHDQVFVIGPSNEAVHAYSDDATVSTSAYDKERSLIAPLISQLRAAMKVASAGLSDSSAAVGSLGARTLVLQGQYPAEISVKPIVAYSPLLTVTPGSEYLHVSVRRVDADVLSEIARTYQLEGLRLVEPTGTGEPQATIPVADSNGKILGFLTWEGDRPGTHMVSDAAPGLIAALLVGGLSLAGLLLRMRRSSAQLTASQAQTQFLAFHDTLTGLPNRALFEDRLDRALIEARRSGKKVALHAIDIDRFKNINDTRGHPAGDELIRIVAARLSAVIRESDTVARLGGDEFAIVQTDVTNLVDAEIAAERMLRAISEPCDLFGERAHVTASIGVVVTTAVEASRAEMLRKADIALYEAKARGRARFQLFAGDMDEVIRRRRLIEDELRLALELGDQLKLVYQPLFAPGSQTMLGAEALVRWDHPIHGRMAPDLFISIAEERGLIEPLGEFVLREAATFALKVGLPWVAVNVSPIQFRNERLASKVLAVLAEVGLPPARLQLEITEGVLLENAGMIEQTLTQLRSGGVRIALDDFGTGYSSMSYLRRYAIDKLKIDRSFVAELGTSPDADAIVRAMIVMARSLRLQVTAEGVETVEQRDHLAALGCHELQGYLLSRPLDERDLLAMLLPPAEAPARLTA